jgi:hypothetical protein
MQFTRVNSNPDETNGLLGVIDKVGLNVIKLYRNEIENSNFKEFPHIFLENLFF